ncbi:phage baseplate assembly protein V [Sphingomonas sp. S-NIH.Pt3_0716]|nr:phage baseplate assembly protein V [Sphingomonas sp. S-NIH.Pt3_0716]
MRTPEDAPTDADQLIRFGTIASVDLAAARCVVDLDDDSHTAPIRWIELRAGKTRTWSPPSKGEQMVVFCPAGEIGAAVALRGLSSDAFPPAGATLKELIEFEDGAIMSYDPVAHAMEIVLPAGASLAITAPGGATITGDLTINGEVRCTGTVTADSDVVGGGKSLKGHKHTGVQAGGAQSGAPA